MEKKTIILSIFLILVMAGMIYLAQDKEAEQTSQDLKAFFSIMPVDWTNPDEPMASWDLQETEVPEGATRLSVSSNGFQPETFEVKKGEQVVLILENADEWTHILKFEDLPEVIVSVGTDRTRGITFYAPSKAGEYGFYCGMPGHKGRGETGIMIVN